MFGSRSTKARYNYRAETDPGSDDPRLSGRTYAIPFEKVWRTCMKFVEGHGRWRLLQADDLAGFIRVRCTTMVFRFDTDDVHPCGGTQQFSYFGQLESGITDSLFGFEFGDDCPPDEDILGTPVLFVEPDLSRFSWFNRSDEGSFLDLDTERCHGAGFAPWTRSTQAAARAQEPCARDLSSC